MKRKGISTPAILAILFLAVLLLVIQIAVTSGGSNLQAPEQQNIQGNFTGQGYGVTLTNGTTINVKGFADVVCTVTDKPCFTSPPTQAKVTCQSDTASPAGNKYYCDLINGCDTPPPTYPVVCAGSLPPVVGPFGPLNPSAPYGEFMHDGGIVYTTISGNWINGVIGNNSAAAQINRAVCINQSGSNTCPTDNFSFSGTLLATALVIGGIFLALGILAGLFGAGILANVIARVGFATAYVVYANGTTTQYFGSLPLQAFIFFNGILLVMWAIVILDGFGGSSPSKAGGED